MGENYLEPSAESAAALFSRQLDGDVVILNLLRFRTTADYSSCTALAPENPISGRAAYQKYIDHTLPLLQRSGGDLLFLGAGGTFFIGPQDERWDLAMLVRQQSLQAFIAFASDSEYLAGIGHRTAAVEDSRLLPLTPGFSP
jgi:uncharacterized protein (DUF1330 family)